jgi:hypothetical protein
VLIASIATSMFKANSGNQYSSYGELGWHFSIHQNTLAALAQ